MNSAYLRVLEIDNIISEKAKNIDNIKDLTLIQNEINEIKNILKDAAKKANSFEYEVILGIIGKWNSFFSYFGKPSCIISIPYDYSYNQIAEELKCFKGIVVSDKMDKTIIVESERLVKSNYNKYIKRTKKFHVHDPDNSCKVGDIVLFTESRPYSKTKHHRLYRRLLNEKLKR
jgi:small subunit ribosomal protein S17